jgi:hypothetical protein
MTENNEAQLVPAMEPIKPVNPLLERARMPGGTFTLPSQGLFYNDGELSADVKNGEVHVLPMVTLDEIILKTPDKLFSGDGIVEVFKRCIPQVNDPMRLLAKDVDFLMVCLRKVTYGDNMEVTYTHDCKDAKEHSYMIPITNFIQESKRIDPTTAGKVFSLELDNGQVLKLRPANLKNVLGIYQSAVGDDEENIESISKNIFDTMVAMIESVDGISDIDMITEWVKTISAGWVHQIGETIDKVSDWGPTFDVVIKCKDCGGEITINTPINPLAFFM